MRFDAAAYSAPNDQAITFTIDVQFASRISPNYDPQSDLATAEPTFHPSQNGFVTRRNFMLIMSVLRIFARDVDTRSVGK